MVSTKSCGYSNSSRLSEGDYSVPFLAPVPVLLYTGATDPSLPYRFILYIYIYMHFIIQSRPYFLHIEGNTDRDLVFDYVSQCPILVLFGEIDR